MPRTTTAKILEGRGVTEELFGDYLGIIGIDLELEKKRKRKSPVRYRYIRFNDSIEHGGWVHPRRNWSLGNAQIARHLACEEIIGVRAGFPKSLVSYVDIDIDTAKYRFDDKRITEIIRWVGVERCLIQLRVSGNFSLLFRCSPLYPGELGRLWTEICESLGFSVTPGRVEIYPSIKRGRRLPFGDQWVFQPEVVDDFFATIWQLNFELWHRETEEIIKADPRGWVDPDYYHGWWVDWYRARSEIDWEGLGWLPHPIREKSKQLSTFRDLDPVETHRLWEQLCGGKRTRACAGRRFKPALGLNPSAARHFCKSPQKGQDFTMGKPRAESQRVFSRASAEAGDRRERGSSFGVKPLAGDPAPSKATVGAERPKPQKLFRFEALAAGKDEGHIFSGKSKGQRDEIFFRDIGSIIHDGLTSPCTRYFAETRLIRHYYGLGLSEGVTENRIADWYSSGKTNGLSKEWALEKAGVLHRLRNHVRTFFSWLRNFFVSFKKVSEKVSLTTEDLLRILKVCGWDEGKCGCSELHFAEWLYDLLQWTKARRKYQHHLYLSARIMRGFSNGRDAHQKWIPRLVSKGILSYVTRTYSIANDEKEGRCRIYRVNWRFADLGKGIPASWRFREALMTVTSREEIFRDFCKVTAWRLNRPRKRIEQIALKDAKEQTETCSEGEASENNADDLSAKEPKSRSDSETEASGSHAQSFKANKLWAKKRTAGRRSPCGRVAPCREQKSQTGKEKKKSGTHADSGVESESQRLRQTPSAETPSLRAGSLGRWVRKRIWGLSRGG